MNDTNNRLDVSAFIGRVRTTAAQSFAQTANEADDALRESISEPYPPASQPGRPPHRRTGKLAEGVRSEVTEDAGGVQFEQGVTRDGKSDVPRFLEKGTSKMEPRPFIAPIAEEFTPKLKDNAVAALRQEFSQR